MNPLRFQVYQRWTVRGRRWFWRLISGNNQVIATGGEGFHNKADAKAIIETIILKVGLGQIERDEV